MELWGDWASGCGCRCMVTLVSVITLVGGCGVGFCDGLVAVLRVHGISFDDFILLRFFFIVAVLC